MPPPHLRDRGDPIVEVKVDEGAPRASESRSRSVERVLTSAIAPGPSGRRHSRSRSRSKDARPRSADSTARMPRLSSQATIGRNSRFSNLSEADKETLGGVEYLALRLLLKIVTGTDSSVVVCKEPLTPSSILLRSASPRCDFPAALDPYRASKIYYLPFRDGPG
jgi:hypothetical protein